jgi:tetratricopeptide (TPR) repeat protein
MTEKEEKIMEQFDALHLRRQGKLDEAIELYRRRLALEPHDARTRADLAVTLSEKGDAAEALKEARMAAESEPENYAIRTTLAYFLLEQQRWPEALTVCKELILMRPGEVASHEFLGDAYHGMGDLRAAIASYEVAAANRKRMPETLDGLGQLYEEAGRLDDAISTYRSLLESWPRFRMGRLHLGRALAASGMPAEARIEWRRILERRDWEGKDRGRPEPPPDEAAILASEYLGADKGTERIRGRESFS